MCRQRREGRFLRDDRRRPRSTDVEGLKPGTLHGWKKNELHVGQPLRFRRSFHDDDETAHEHFIALVNANLDAAPQKTERDHDDKIKGVDEPVSPVSLVAQDEVSTVGPVHFDSETKDGEIAVSVALPEEPTRMFFKIVRARSLKKHSSQSRLETSATAEGKDEPLVTCRKT